MDLDKFTPLGVPDPRQSYTVILADGDYPSAGYAVSLLQGARRVICCDGAADRYTADGGTPLAIVGDLDSVSPGVKKQYGSLLRHDGDQETNDLTKAVVFCSKELQGHEDIIILGATGKREDHTIGNISLLADYNTLYGLPSRVRMVTDRGIIDHIDRDTAFESFAGQQVTILCTDPSTRITTRNLKYPLVDANLRAWWQGTLNESEGPRFGIATDGDTFIYRLWQGDKTGLFNPH